MIILILETLCDVVYECMLDSTVKLQNTNFYLTKPNLTRPQVVWLDFIQFALITRHDSFLAQWLSACLRMMCEPTSAAISLLIANTAHFFTCSRG